MIFGSFPVHVGGRYEKLLCDIRFVFLSGSYLISPNSHLFKFTQDVIKSNAYLTIIP